MADKYVGDSRHRPSFDASRINRAVERAAGDASFIDDSVALLRGMQFPAFKHAIIQYAKRSRVPDEVEALFESLDGYIEYRDLYHLQKSLEQNNPAKKRSNQITDKTRTEPDVRTRPTDAEASIKERQAIDASEERGDYQVTPTATSNFICERCGKPFQNQDDLFRHRQFESEASVT